MQFWLPAGDGAMGATVLGAMDADALGMLSDEIAMIEGVGPGVGDAAMDPVEATRMDRAANTKTTRTAISERAGFARRTVFTGRPP